MPFALSCDGEIAMPGNCLAETSQVSTGATWQWREEMIVHLRPALLGDVRSGI